MESDSVCNHTSDYKISGVRFVNPHEYDYRPTSDDTRSTLPITHKDYNFREAQEIKILLGNNHAGIQSPRSLTTLKIIS